MKPPPLPRNVRCGIKATHRPCHPPRDLTSLAKNGALLHRLESSRYSQLIGGL
jgi:hypothetical protein